MAHIVKERPETQPKKKKLSKGTRILRNIVIVIVAIALLLGAAVFVLDHFGRSQLTDDGAAMTVIEDAELDNAGRVRYKGQLYEYKKDVTTILLMGVDSRNKEDTEGEFGRSNQSDMNVLAVLDPQTHQITLINISRDSMADVDIYNVDGEYAGVEEMQICLAYAYGDGAHSSCQNVSKSVTRLLYGIPMDIYASIELPAVNVLNDAVGGVTLDVLEDLSSRDPALTKGALVTLNGDQARIYVQSRNHESLDGNNSRMARQKQYLAAFLNTVQRKVRQKRLNPGFLTERSIQLKTLKTEPIS